MVIESLSKSIKRELLVKNKILGAEDDPDILGLYQFEGIFPRGLPLAHKADPDYVFVPTINPSMAQDRLLIDHATIMALVTDGSMSPKDTQGRESRDGFELALWCKQHYSYLPVAMISASAVSREDAERYGIDVAVRKPIDLDVLAEISRSFLLIRLYKMGITEALEDLRGMFSSNTLRNMLMLG